MRIKAADLLKKVHCSTFAPCKTPSRGVVEWFIAPVLKTGDRSRGPGVRIPPPLPTSSKVPCTARDFLFSLKPTETQFRGGEKENKKPAPTQEGPGF